MDRDEMGNLYRKPSIDASYQVSGHLANQFQRRRFLKIGKNLVNQKEELPIAAMFLMNQNKMSNLYRGPSVDASYQVSIHLSKQFQRRRCFKNRLETGIACGGHVC